VDAVATEQVHVAVLFVRAVMHRRELFGVALPLRLFGFFFLVFPAWLGRELFGVALPLRLIPVTRKKIAYMGP
jgi:hypothetical protein